MKRIWIALALVFCIVAAGTAALFHLKSVTDEMEASLVRISDAVRQQDRPEALRLIEEFKAQWEDNEAEMMRYIHHDELDTITGTVARLSALAEYREDAELAAEVQRLHHLIRHIFESELPVFRNIF